MLNKVGTVARCHIEPLCKGRPVAKMITRFKDSDHVFVDYACHDHALAMALEVISPSEDQNYDRRALAGLTKADRAFLATGPR